MIITKKKKKKFLQVFFMGRFPRYKCLLNTKTGIKIIGKWPRCFDLQVGTASKGVGIILNNKITFMWDILWNCGSSYFSFSFLFLFFMSNWLPSNYEIPANRKGIWRLTGRLRRAWCLQFSNKQNNNNS